MDFFPVDLEDVLELQTVEGHEIFFVIIEELVGEFAPEILHVLAALSPANVLGLLKMFTVYVGSHALNDG